MDGHMEITIRDVTYEIKEATVGDIMPYMALMQSDPQAFQSKLMASVVCVDGEPLGEHGLSALPLSVFMELVPAVTDMQGFGSEEGKS